jgi:hypothetical protein
MKKLIEKIIDKLFYVQPQKLGSINIAIIKVY